MSDNGAPATAPFIMGSVAVPSVPFCAQFDGLDCVGIWVGSGCESAPSLPGGTLGIVYPNKGGLPQINHGFYILDVILGAVPSYTVEDMAHSG